MLDQAQFSRYRVVSRLGHGGMGEVFLAEDVSLHRKCALKFLQAGDADDTADQRLLREARAAAHLDHPFICKVYDIGEHEGRPFLAMEYVEGITLGARLAQGRIPVHEALRMAIEVADALHFAHTRGIVHRDLKPANVMLGADGHVKVMDFGLAKRIATPTDADAVTVNAVTASEPGHFAGTFAYMSPEQLRGQPVDARSDVFAFGVVLHELLSGRNPFMRPSMPETTSAILAEPVAPLESTRGETPPLLAHIVARCLEKDRQRRYQSMADVRIELDTLLAGGAAIGSAATGKPWRKWHGWAAAAVAVLALAAVQWLRPLPFLTPEPALAFEERDWLVVTDFNNLTGDAVFDRSLRLALEVAIGQSQHVNVFPQNRVATTLQRMQRPPAEKLDEGLATEVAVREGIRGVLACDIAQVGSVYSLTARLIDPRTRAAVLTDSVTANGKDDVLAALGRLATRVRSNLGESIEGLSKQASELPSVTTSSLDALKLYADSLKRASGSDGSTNDMLRQAIALDPEFALAHAELGRRYYLASDRKTRELAETHLTRALGLSDRLSLRERLWIEAITEDSRGNRARAVDAYKTYLAQYPDDTSALFRMSWTQMAALGQSAEAAEGFTRLLQIDPGNASAHVNLASCLSGMGRFDEAVTAYHQAFALDPPLALEVFINHEYGFTLVKLGRLDEALRTFERMKESAAPVDKAKGFRSAALLQMLRGHYGAAVSELQGAIALNQTHREAVSEFRDRMYLIAAYEATSRSPEARAEWAVVDRLITANSLSPTWLWRVVRTHARSGRLNEARRQLDRMHEWAGKATAASGVSRNVPDDVVYISVAEAEVALAQGRTAEALERIEPAHLHLKMPETLFTLATTYAATGRLDQAITRYEELLSKPSLGYEAQELWLDAHLALGQLYERQQRIADATRTYQALTNRWKDADSDTVLLRKVRARLEPLGGGATVPGR